MRHNFLTYCAIALLAVLAGSCSTPKVGYLQDRQPESTYSVQKPQGLVFEPGDKLSVIISSKDQEIAAMFNLSTAQRRLGTNTRSINSNEYISVYTVDSDGYIDLPVLGPVKVAGLTRNEVNKKIKNELSSRKLLNDAVVSTEFYNMYVNVLGEVTKPGRYALVTDNPTIFDVLSDAGDITIYGLKDKVMVQREVNGEVKTYTVDLTSANAYTSPVYYVRQNDIIYVEPNSTRARQSTVNGNNVRSTSFWISLTSLLTSVTSVVFLTIRK